MQSSGAMAALRQFDRTFAAPVARVPMRREPGRKSAAADGASGKCNGRGVSRGLLHLMQPFEFLRFIKD